MLKIALCGLRHNHAAGIAKHVHQNPRLEIVAACEAEPDACRDIIAKAGVDVSHSSLDAMIDEVDFDILAVADIFCRRGAHTIRALEAGKHVLSDKPLCTSLAELDRIQQLASDRNLSVIAQLPLRSSPIVRRVEQLIRDGAIGDIATITVFGRHGLQYGTGRPDWFFQPGQQGGTINDLFVHGIDLIEGVTGRRFAEVVAARAWNQQLPQASHFQDAAQVLMRLDNGAGVMMDASYTTPSGHGDPWTLFINGTGGDITMTTRGDIRLRQNNQDEQQLDPADEAGPHYLDELIANIRPDGTPEYLTTDISLRMTRIALLAQQAADEDIAHHPIPD